MEVAVVVVAVVVVAVVVVAYRKCSRRTEVVSLPTKDVVVVVMAHEAVDSVFLWLLASQW